MDYLNVHQLARRNIRMLDINYINLNNNVTYVVMIFICCPEKNTEIVLNLASTKCPILKYSHPRNWHSKISLCRLEKYACFLVEDSETNTTLLCLCMDPISLCQIPAASSWSLHWLPKSSYSTHLSVKQHIDMREV